MGPPLNADDGSPFSLIFVVAYEGLFRHLILIPVANSVTGGLVSDQLVGIEDPKRHGAGAEGFAGSRACLCLPEARYGWVS